MVNFRSLADRAKKVVDKRGGTDALKEDAEELKARGVAAVFTPGAPTSEIVGFLQQAVPAG